MNKIKIIDYLYGEMNADEEKAFINEMEENAALRKEVEALRETSNILGSHQIEAAPLTTVIVPSKKKWPIHSRWWALAASLILLLCIGRLLDIKVTVDDHQFAIQYGDPELMEDKEPDPAREELTALMAQMAQLQEEWIGFKNQPEETAENLDYVQLKKEMTQWVSHLKQQQEKNSALMMKEFKADQEQHTAMLVNEFLEYVETQRQEDLIMINEGFKNLAEMILVGGDPKIQFAYNKTQK
jgi:hypothetical protein